MSSAAEWWMKKVRELPCSVCGKSFGSDAHHPRDSALGRKFGRKAPDTLVVALCRDCHNRLHDGIESFERQHGEEWKLLARTIEGMAKRLRK